MFCAFNNYCTTESHSSSACLTGSEKVDIHGIRQVTTDSFEGMIGHMTGLFGLSALFMMKPCNNCEQ